MKYELKEQIQNTWHFFCYLMKVVEEKRQKNAI